MKLLVLGMSPQFLRPFVPAIQELARRGHRLTVAWTAESRGGEAHLDELGATPGVTCRLVPGRRSEHWEEVALLRRSWNYLRYLEAPYREAGKLRERAFMKAARLLFDAATPVDEAWADMALSLSDRERKRLRRLTEFVESVLPTDPVCDGILEEEQPDAVLLTPLVDLNASSQADFAQAARRRGIPFGMLVYSWDNLSTKGGLHVIPDRVFVWNPTQALEARRLHGVPREHVKVVGAPRFDAFLACERKHPRGRFSAALGFPDESPIVLYVCSSAFVSGQELTFVRRWLAALRTSGVPALSGVNVIVRPHPDIPLTSSDERAEKVDLGAEHRATVWRPFDDPRALVLGTPSRHPQSLFECIAHSSVVVGLNTTAEIEGGLLGRPVLSVRAGGAADGQTSTLHYRYLLEEEGGWVRMAADLTEHVRQLQEALLASDEQRREIQRRARLFVRPQRVRKPVTPILADAIEREMGALSGLVPPPV